MTTSEIAALTSAQVDEIINRENAVLNQEELELLERVIEEEVTIIPPNSDTLLIDEQTSRFSSAVWYQKVQSKNIIVAGIGGIGSYVVYLLSRMKPAGLFLYDSDTVELANLSGQLFSMSDIGRRKVDAIASMINNYSNYTTIFTNPNKYDSSSPASNIMICGFDNMGARKIFFYKWLEHVQSKPEEERKNCLFIDGRLNAEEFQVLCIQGDDIFSIKKYEEEYLFSDAEVDTTVCSYKQTTFMANMIASTMVNCFVNFAANQCDPLIERSLPFYTYYNAELMYFKTL